MKACWFILIDGKKEGPYSVRALKKHPKVTPLTLVWKKGFSKWVPLGSIPELEEVVQKPNHITHPMDDQKLDALAKQGGVIAEPQRFHPAPHLWWIFALIILLLFFIYRFWVR